MAHVDEERAALGARLAAKRNALGFSLTSAAAALQQKGFKIGRGTIGAWETGRNLPDALWLQRLARLYGTTLDGLAWPDALSPFSPELWKTVLRLKPEDLTTLEGVMRAHLKMAPVAAEVDTNQTGRILPDSTVSVTPSPPAHQPTSFVAGLVAPGEELERREVDQVHGKRRGGKPKGTPPRG